MASRQRRRTTADAQIPGSFEGETVTRRRFMTTAAHTASAIAASAIALPVIGFAVAPVFHRLVLPWQDVGPASDFANDTYAARVISLTPDDVGEASKTTVFIRKRNPEIDSEPEDRWNHYIALSSRCAHVGCPVGFKAAAQAFVCPCHGGVYDMQGKRIGGPPPRPLDRFFTRVRNGQLQIGPRYSVNSRLKRFAPRDPGESLDGIGPDLYPPRPSTAAFPK
jgi:menaquinol-cytochrome c reductase iron-sulfur subunit